MRPGSDYSASLATQPDFRDRLEQGMYSLCYLSQALMQQEQEQKSKRKIRLLYVYSNPNDHPQPQYAAISGLLKAIHLENPRLICKTVEIERAD